MKTYVADPKIARKWYLKKRKTYKTYKIGMAVMWGALCLIFILDLSFLLRAEGIEQLGEILLLCIGADILPFSVFCRYPDFDELKDELMALGQANFPASYSQVSSSQK